MFKAFFYLVALVLFWRTLWAANLTTGDHFVGRKIALASLLIAVALVTSLVYLGHLGGRLLLFFTGIFLLCSRFRF